MMQAENALGDLPPSQSHEARHEWHQADSLDGEMALVLGPNHQRSGMAAIIGCSCRTGEAS